MKYIVVLGEKLLTHDKMSAILKNRLDVCLQHYQEGDVVIVCGGNVCGKPRCRHSEAYVMRKYLVSKGIKSNLIILENQSKNTIENIQYLNKICYDKKIKKLTIVTSHWHQARVRHICKMILSSHIKISFKTSQDEISTRRQKLEDQYLYNLKLE